MPHRHHDPVEDDQESNYTPGFPWLYRYPVGLFRRPGFPWTDRRKRKKEAPQPRKPLQVIGALAGMALALAYVSILFEQLRVWDWIGHILKISGILPVLPTALEVIGPLMLVALVAFGIKRVAERRKG